MAALAGIARLFVYKSILPRKSRVAVHEAGKTARQGRDTPSIVVRCRKKAFASFQKRP
jgi:hypothetical protein